MSELSEEQIIASNRRDSWREVEQCLSNAHDAVEWAQGCLSDLHEEGYAEQLQPIVDVLRQARADARERAAQ